MKQTAVEWLYNKFSTCTSDELVGNINNWFNEAKEMEKEQIVDAFNQGYTQRSIEDLKPTSRDRYEDAEDYINKIYKSK